MSTDIIICCIIQALFAGVSLFVDKCRGAESRFLKTVFKYSFTAVLAALLTVAINTTATVVVL